MRVNTLTRAMHNPPPPCEVLREYLGDMSLAEAAAKIGVSRVTLEIVLSGAAGISPEMVHRLSDAFGTSPELWAGVQSQFDLHRHRQL